MNNPPPPLSTRIKGVPIALLAMVAMMEEEDLALEARLDEQVQAERLKRRHTLSLQGQQYVAELLSGPDSVFVDNYGMKKHVFLKVVEQLRIRGGMTDGRWVTLKEQLAIFLYICVNNSTNRNTQHRFQHSGETVHKYFFKILAALCSPPLHDYFIKLPAKDEPLPSILRDNPRFKLFQNCLSALDGTHISCNPPAEDRAAYRNYKHELTQNVLAVCDFDFNFVFVLAGWEGSAQDNRVLNHALATDFTIPEGLYYLADGGYGFERGLLGPYPKVAYHLDERRRAGKKAPENAKELFNLRHAVLRNIIERIFGVMKRRFKILKVASDYNVQAQAFIILGLCVVHNAIRQFDPTQDGEEFDLDAERNEDEDDRRRAMQGGENAGSSTWTDQQKEQFKVWRDDLAETMWDQYQHYLATGEQG